MNYDLTDLPAGYDRGRALDPEVLALWMDAIATHLQGLTITRVLDLGCGTGRFSDALARHFDVEVIGVEPSAKMLARAREKSRAGVVRYVRGFAEALPLASGTVDMVFMSMSFHHFTDQRLAAGECRRVIRDGGLPFRLVGSDHPDHRANVGGLCGEARRGRGFRSREAGSRGVPGGARDGTRPRGSRGGRGRGRAHRPYGPSALKRSVWGQSHFGAFCCR